MAILTTQQTTGLLPTTDTTQSTTNTINQQQQQGQNLNVYSPQQSAAQSASLGMLGGVLSGQQSIPQSLGLPQSVRDMSWWDFNNNQAPVINAQLGPGSVAAQNSARQELQMRLNALSAQNAASNFSNLMGQNIDAAFRPLGYNTNQTGMTNQVSQTNQTETSSNPGGAIGALMGLIGSAIQSLPF